jgi:hypothetical protein
MSSLRTPAVIKDRPSSTASIREQFSEFLERYHISLSVLNLWRLYYLRRFIISSYFKIAYRYLSICLLRRAPLLHFLSYLCYVLHQVLYVFLL